MSSSNPHHFALPTPPSDHECEANYTNVYNNNFDAYSRGQSSTMSSPRGYTSSSSHSSAYGSAYATPTASSAQVAAAAAAFAANGVPSPNFLNGMSNLMNSAFSSVGHFALTTNTQK